jgi:hypothetical protein
MKQPIQRNKIIKGDRHRGLGAFVALLMSHMLAIAFAFLLCVSTSLHLLLFLPEVPTHYLAINKAEDADPVYVC